MKKPYFPFYVNDWLSDSKVIRMKPETRGGYIHLLCYDWSDDGLEDDDENLATLSGLNSQWNANALQLRKCFVKCEDGRLRNPKLSNIRTANKLYSDEQKARAEKRWGKPMQVQCDGNAGAMPEPCGPASEKTCLSLSLALASSLALSLSRSMAVALSYIEKKKKEKIKTFLFGIEHSERAERLHDFIIQRDPNFKITGKKIEAWANEVRLMMERDNRTLGEIDAVIEFSQTDEFWRNNILSMQKLRKQFTQLLLKSNAPRNTKERWQAERKQRGQRIRATQLPPKPPDALTPAEQKKRAKELADGIAE